MSKQIYVTKMNGDKEPYNEKKLHNSLERAGADKETINEITGKVDKMLYDGIDTKSSSNLFLQN